jgi:hypothetical protein
VPPPAQPLYTPCHPRDLQHPVPRVLLLGIDPDCHGAIAAVSAELHPVQGIALPGQEQQQQNLMVALHTARVTVHDMPVELIPLQQRHKSAPQRFRRCAACGATRCLPYADMP